MFPTNFSFDQNTILVKSNEFVHRINPDNTAILVKLSEEDEFYKIDGVASILWQAIDGKSTVGQILDVLLNEYDVDLKQLVEDAGPFLDRLIELKIVLLKK